MEAAGSCEMFVPVYQITLRHVISEHDPNLLRQNPPLYQEDIKWNSTYPDRVGPSGKHFVTLVLHPFKGLNPHPPDCQIHISNYVLMLYL
jgi:hypothetical protein